MLTQFQLNLNNYYYSIFQPQFTLFYPNSFQQNTSQNQQNFDAGKAYFFACKHGFSAS